MNKKNKLLKKILLTASMIVVFCVAVLNEASASCLPGPNYEFCMRGIASVFPADNSVGVITNPTLSITFVNPTIKSTGNLRVYEVGAGVVQTIPCSTLAGAGTTFSRGLTLAANKDYYVNYDAFCFGNATSITNTSIWNFSTRQSIALVSSIPSNGQSDVCLSQGLTLTFNQPMYPDLNNRGGTIRLSCAGSPPLTEVCGPSTFTGGGTNTLSKDFSFAKDTTCNIRISNNCIHNAGNQYWTGNQINFGTNSTSCSGGICSFPVLRPADDATNVRVDSDLTLTWNTIWLYETSYDVISRVEVRRSSDNSVYAQYSLNVDGPSNDSSLLKISGAYTNRMTIDPKVNFPPSTSFYVQITSVVLKNCPKFTINDTTTWNFTTGSPGPLTLLKFTPRTNRSDVNPDTPLELKFSGTVYLGSGNLRVYETIGDVLLDTVPASSPRIFLDGDLVKIYPVNGLVYDRDYYITVDEGFLNGGSVTLPSRAIEKGQWYFKTKFAKIYEFWKIWGYSDGSGSSKPTGI